MKKLLAIVSMVAVMGAGCAAQTPSTTTPPAGGTGTEGKMSMAQFMTGSWKIKSMQLIGGQARDVSSSDFMITFDGEKISGKICNSMNGPYTVEDNAVKFGAVAMTKMFCEGLPGEVEAAFAARLNEQGYTAGKSGENLTLVGSSAFVLERQGASGTEDGKVY